MSNNLGLKTALSWLYYLIMHPSQTQNIQLSTNSFSWFQSREYDTTCSLTQLLLVIVAVESFLQTKRRKEFAGVLVNNQNYPAFYLIAGVSLVVVFFILNSFHFSLWLAFFRSCKK